MAADDISQIINTINTYPIAVDTLNFDLFDLTFTEDAFVDFGGPAQWNDLAAMKRDFAFVHEPFHATQHNTSNHRVTVSGDTAHAISYVNARFIREIEGGSMFQVSGWYDDELVRTPAGWRISKRINRSFWEGGNPDVMNTMPGVTVKLTHNPLSKEAAAGQVMYLKALKGS